MQQLCLGPRRQTRQRAQSGPLQVLTLKYSCYALSCVCLFLCVDNQASAVGLWPCIDSEARSFVQLQPWRRRWRPAAQLGGGIVCQPPSVAGICFYEVYGGGATGKLYARLDMLMPEACKMPDDVGAYAMRIYGNLEPLALLRASRDMEGPRQSRTVNASLRGAAPWANCSEYRCIC